MGNDHPKAPGGPGAHASPPARREDAVTLELLAELPDVRVERVAVGSVTVRREREVRRETFTLDLVTERVVVRLERDGASEDAPLVTVDGQALEPGQELRLEVYREEASVGKTVAVHERVTVGRVRSSERVAVPVELAREVLAVDTQGEARVREEWVDGEVDSSPSGTPTT